MKPSNLRPAFRAICLLFAGAAAQAAPLELSLTDVKGKAVVGTVVTLRSTDASRPMPAPVNATMDQLDLEFVPHVLVVPQGSKVNFPNSDKVHHHVYSFSEDRNIDLGLYRGKAPDPVDFPRRGIFALGCNVHDLMRAYIYVVDAHYVGRTDADGIWRVADVAPGEYELVIWHPLARGNAPILEQKITIAAAARPLTLRLAKPLKLRPSAQIPANWDAY